MRSRSTIRWLRATLREACRATPLPLALLRIALAAVLLATHEPEHAVAWLRSGSPPSPPFGLQLFAKLAPLDVGFASSVRVAYYASAALVLVGLYTRIAAGVLFVSASYLFAIVSMGGAVLHDMHLLWLLAIVATSASGEALSLDARFAGAPFLPRGLPSRRFGVPTFFARTLLGVVYFFPGLHKLRTSGLSWALSDNLVHQMHAKWLEVGSIPPWRIDLHPEIVKLGGLVVLAFELSFIFLVHVGPRSRVLLAAVGVAFHLSTERFLFIPFESLWIPYVVLLDGPLSRFFVPSKSAVTSPTAAEPPAPIGSLLVGSLLVAAATVMGALGVTQAFPFACYPTFAELQGDELPDLLVTADLEMSVREVPVARDDAGRRSQADWGAVWSVMGAYGAPYEKEHLARWFAAEARRPNVARALDGARSIRFEIVARKTAPELWSTPPTRRRLLVTLPWPP